MSDQSEVTFTLSEDAVWRRILSADDDLLQELQATGERWYSEILESIRSLETKATTLAGYGAGVVTLLVSTSTLWSKAGNGDTLVFMAFAAFSAVKCNMLSAATNALLQRGVSTDEGWLNLDYLGDAAGMRRYRILSLWSLSQELDRRRSEKAQKVRKAELWLKMTTLFVLLLLLHIVILQIVGYCLSPQSSDVQAWLRENRLDSWLSHLGAVILSVSLVSRALWRLRQV